MSPATLSVSQLTLYNPSRLNDAEIIAAFVARKTIFDRVLADIAAEKPGSRPQHHLIVGQRGMGKSTLLMRLAAELRTNAKLSDRFVPLVFAEEQYAVDRLSKFWLNCLDSLADAAERAGDVASSDRIDAAVRTLKQRVGGTALKDDVPARAALEAFEKAAKSGGKRPVLLVDNLQLVFERISPVEQHALRELLMRPGSPIVVGSSPSPPASTQDYGAAFYDHFKTHYLRALSADEMRQLMLKLADTTERFDVREKVLAHPERLKTLRELTGGNPRTLVALFFLYTEDFSPSVFADLENLLDRVTPLYKARIEELADQQQVLVSAVADHWAPITARGLSEATGLPMASISAQLDRLERIGVVEKVEIFGQSSTGYQIAERFFNVWFLMRSASRRRRREVEFLVRFIESFYEAKDRPRLARRLLQEREWTPDRFQFARALASTLDPADREELIRKAIEINPRDASAWDCLGDLLQKHLGRYDEAESAYRKAIESDPQSETAWNGLGNLYFEHLNRYPDAVAAYTRALAINSSYDTALQNLIFVLRDSLGDREAARRTLESFYTELPDHTGDTDQLHEALFAAYDQNWGLCGQELAGALDDTNCRVPVEIDDPWLRATAVLIHLNYAENLLAFLRERGDDARLRPWYEAISALHQSDRRYLQNVPVEVRATAEYYFDQIEKRLSALPEKTSRRPASKHVKKRRKKKKRRES